MSKVSVIGLGYIGLPTALMLASKGADVTGVDYSETLIGTLKSGTLTFEEEGLSDVFRDALSNGIKFTNEYVSSDIYIVAVQTPYQKETKTVDAKYVVSAVNSVLDVCESGSIIVVESTVSPGTMDKYIRPVVEARGLDISLAHAPERIIPGNMINELENNSRTIGVDDAKVGELLKELYGSFCNGDIVVTDIRTAEMSKVVENTYRDINIAFANELARICSDEDMDVYEIIKIANMHPRVNVHTPGPGVGGHCISVDPWFLVGDYPKQTRLIRTARDVNDSMPEFVYNRIKDIMRGNGIIDMSKVGLYGLTYKEDVDDTRESPTLQLLKYFKEETPYVFDPVVNKELVKGQLFNFNEFLDKVEIVVILVGHTHIKENIDMLNGKVIFDTKNIVDGAYKL